MSSSDEEWVRVVLFFNGRKIEGRRGLVFEGEKRMTRIKRKTTLGELHEKIRPKLGLQDTTCITSLTARIWQDEQYVGFPAQDDEELEMVIEEFLKHARKNFLEFYVDYTTVEDVVLPRRSVACNSAHIASSYGAVGANMSEEDSHDPTWVMDDDEDDDDDENIAMEDRLLQENASASDNDEDSGVHASAFQQHRDVGSTDLRNHPDVGPRQSEQLVEGGAVIPFWDGIPHYTYIDWNHPSEEESFSGSASGSGSVQGPWQLGDDLFVQQEFSSKKEAQIAVKRNLMREHQEAFVVESKPDRFAMKCVAHSDGCPL